MSTQITGITFPENKLPIIIGELRKIVLSCDFFIDCVCRDEIEINLENFKKKALTYFQVFEISKKRFFGRIVSQSNVSDLGISSSIYDIELPFCKLISYDTRADPSVQRMENMSNKIDLFVIQEKFVLIEIFSYEICKDALKKYQ